jgi:peptide/nickel transport system ATP-binding protein
MLETALLPLPSGEGRGEAHPRVAAALRIKDLSVAFPTSNGWLQALDKLTLTIPPGTVLGLVGESGSGKSTALLALLGLAGATARVTATTLSFDNQNLLTHATALRGRRIGMVFQDTAAALNPALTVGAQLIEPMRLHLRLTARQAWARGIELLAETGLPRPARIMGAYPHQLSGGMKQRVGIATALATEPALLLLDEPTTALDVTIEAQILALLDELRARRGLAMLLVSHNLGIVDRLADHVAVLYAGRVVETGPTAEILHRPNHPYTKGLLAALPRPDRPHAGRLAPIPGSLPDLTNPAPGCNFQPRCPFAAEGCDHPQILQGDTHQTACHRAQSITEQTWPTGSTPPPITPTPPNAPPLLDAQNLSIRFETGGWLARRLGRASSVQAVDDVSLRIETGEVLGLVGESGCGKSTLGRLLLRLLPTDSGTITFAGQIIPDKPGQDFRRLAQIVFQNPDTALNPRHTVATILGRAINWFAIATGAAVAEATNTLLDHVRLPRRYASRFPHQLSGGEKQRVGIARALASSPAFLVCDEAVSALDVSVQAAILNLVSELRAELGVAILFISHDIGVIAHIADRIAVMYGGSIMEQGRAVDVLHPPYHPYTELLLASVPLIGKPHAPPPHPGTARASTPQGCKFAARCPRHLGLVCDTSPAPIQNAGPHHTIRCHIPIETLATVPHWLTTSESPTP